MVKEKKYMPYDVQYYLSNLLYKTEQKIQSDLEATRAELKIVTTDRELHKLAEKCEFYRGYFQAVKAMGSIIDNDFTTIH